MARVDDDELAELWGCHCKDVVEGGDDAHGAAADVWRRANLDLARRVVDLLGQGMEQVEQLGIREFRLAMTTAANSAAFAKCRRIPVSSVVGLRPSFAKAMVAPVRS